MRFLKIADRLRETAIRCCNRTCRKLIPASHAMVPDFINLYLGARKGPVDKGHPLTSQELAMDAHCVEHPLKGVHMFPLLETAARMDSWADENVRRMNQAHRPHHHKPQHASGPLGPIAQILVQRKPEVEKPRPQYRQHRHLPKPPKSTVKRYGDEGRKNTPVVSAKAAAKAAKAAKEAAKKARR